MNYPATNNGNGTWTLADNTLPTLTDGPHTITVTATDPAGNVGTTNAVVTVDTTAPNAPVIDPINASNPVTGTAEPGSTVKVTFPDGSTATVLQALMVNGQYQIQVISKMVIKLQQWQLTLQATHQILQLVL